jgi:hypothetical protein
MGNSDLKRQRKILYKQIVPHIKRHQHIPSSVSKTTIPVESIQCDLTARTCAADLTTISATTTNAKTVGTGEAAFSAITFLFHMEMADAP